MDQSIRLIEVVAKLVGDIAWPLVLIYFVNRFSSPLYDLLAALGEVSLKVAGFEATAKRRQAEATAALAAAEVARQTDPLQSCAIVSDVRNLAHFVNKNVSLQVLRSIADSKLLWVDDNPSNNIYLRQSLEALGISIELARSTDEALGRLSSEHFDAIISDMARTPDANAGYTLLRILRESGNKTPYVIYTESGSIDYKAKSTSLGAVGCTNRPDELIRLVLQTLRSRNSHQ
jgi:CheY-like chemotaxis protein